MSVCEVCGRPEALPGTGEGCERTMLSKMGAAARVSWGHIIDCEREGRRRAERERDEALRRLELLRQMADEVAGSGGVRAQQESITVHEYVIRATEELARQRDEARTALANLVQAMRVWGAEEDGVPEDGPVGAAYDAAERLLGRCVEMK